MSELEKRTIDEAEYIISTQRTVRQAAEHFNISKSTLHSDLKNRLPKINFELYIEVDKILKTHFEQKHLRGGNATKLNWQRARTSNIER